MVSLPFITRLSHNKRKPDNIFAVGTSGVWKSRDFGVNWSLTPLQDSQYWLFRFNTDVEVSNASPNVVWTGVSLTSSSRLFVSTDAGESFNPTNAYVNEMGTVSGIGTHPTEDSTAYALFSFASNPKILRTTDLGQTWEDISGFDGSGERGFPDVAVNSIFIFPNDVNKIWAGTEIGIVESLDNGVSWALLDANMPPVNIYDMKLSENVLVIATYGRGIWSYKIDEIGVPPIVSEVHNKINNDVFVKVSYAEAPDSVQLYIGDDLVQTYNDRPSGDDELSYQNSSYEGHYDISTVAYVDGVPALSNIFEGFLFLVLDETSSFSAHFDADDTSHFAFDGLTIKTEESEFPSSALHSEHPYQNNTNAFAYLKTPIVVQANATLSYNDIAILEVGEANSSFGDEGFYDYAVLEGSKDGIEWKPLLDGYDASYYHRWKAAYDDEATADPYMLQFHELDMSSTFAVDDVILLRFRLFADPFSNGYGWIVDNLRVQTSSTNHPPTGINISKKYRSREYNSRYSGRYVKHS